MKDILAEMANMYMPEGEVDFQEPVNNAPLEEEDDELEAETEITDEVDVDDIADGEEIEDEVETTYSKDVVLKAIQMVIDGEVEGAEEALEIASEETDEDMEDVESEEEEAVEGDEEFMDDDSFGESFSAFLNMSRRYI
jgi:hypothetical protein